MAVLEREAAKNGIKLVLDMGDCDSAEIYAAVKGGCDGSYYRIRACIPVPSETFN